VAPNVGAPAFALASRAVVVGDVWQIEPVSGITKPVDRGNARRSGVYDLVHSGDSGGTHCASTSSIMRQAQAAASITDPEAREPGIRLREHWRCQKPIIEYCNQLIYHDLIACRFPDVSERRPLPFFGWAHVNGEERRSGGSWPTTSRRRSSRRG
jgi:hypothetical protein